MIILGPVPIVPIGGTGVSGGAANAGASTSSLTAGKLFKKKNNYIAFIFICTICNLAIFLDWLKISI